MDIELQEFFEWCEEDESFWADLMPVPTGGGIG